MAWGRGKVGVERVLNGRRTCRHRGNYEDSSVGDQCSVEYSASSENEDQHNDHRTAVTDDP